MIESYKRFWQNIFTIDGKSNRPDYWWPVIINYILGAIIISVIQSITGHSINTIYDWKDVGLNSLRNLVLILVWIATLTVKIRRLHDTNRSGWWVLIEIIPLIGTIWFFILMILPGKRYTRWD